MKTARLNVRFFLRSTLVMVVGGLLVFLVHAWQIRRHAVGQLALAAQAEQDHKADEFLAALNRYLQFDPANKEVRVHYALALADRATTTRDRWRALQVVRQALAETSDRPEVRLRAVELALALKEPEQAGKYLEPLLQAEPGRADLHLLAARCEQARNEPQAAAQSLKRALALAPRVETAESLAALYRDRLGQPRLAQAVLDGFVADHPGEPAAHLARARHALAEARLDAAAADLERASLLAPNAVEVVQMRAEIALLRGQFDLACQSWHRAITLAPSRIELYLGLARAERERGQTSAAIDALRQSRRQAPQRIDILFGLADLLIDAGKTGEAGDLQKQLATAAPGRSWFLRGRLAQHDQRWLDAINALNTTLSSGDASARLAGRAYFELSRCYAALGGSREELLSLESAVRLSPDLRPQERLAQRLIQHRRLDEALALLHKLTRSPASPTRTWILQARALVETNRTLPASQQRWDEVEQAIARAGRDPALGGEVALLRADRFVLNNDFAQARTTLEQARKKHPNDPALYLAQADLAARQGDDRHVAALLEQGDGVFKDRLDWLTRRIDRLTAEPTPRASRELAELEARAVRLPAPTRERVEQQLVNVHRHLGNHADVKRLCKTLLSHNPKSVEGRRWLSEALLAVNAISEAQREIDLLRKAEGEDGLDWRCARAELLIRQGDRPDAERLAEARRLVAYAHKARPNWSYPIYLLARIDDHERHTDEALAGYRRVLELGDYRPTALARTLEILDGKKLWGEAFAVCERALQRGLLDREMQRVAAHFAVKANKPSRARDLATLVVPEGNRVYRDQLWLGGILDGAGRTTAAREAFEKAIGLAPDAAEPYLALVAHHVRHHSRADAAATLEQMESALAPQQKALAVARAHEIMGQPDKAEQAYRKILQGQPCDADALSRLASLLVRYNKPVEAEAVLLRLLDRRVALAHEDVPDLRRRLALAMTAPERSDDRMESALELLRQNRLQFGDSAADQRVRALVEGRRADRRAAALKTVEGLPGTLLPEEQLRLARLYDAQGDKTHALAALLEIVEGDPRNTSLMAFLIDFLLRHNQRTQAAEWIDRLEKEEPGSKRLREFRARWAKRP